MIFPALRISQLTRDVEEKRAALGRSTDGLKSAALQSLNPLTLLKRNPGWLLGAAASVISAGSIGSLVLGFFGSHKNGKNGKNGKLKSETKSGLLSRLVRFGGRTLIKSVTPVAFSAASFAVKAALRSFKNREA